MPTLGLGDGGGVGEHADSASNLCQVTSRDYCWRLVVDANLEPGWTPINKLDAPFGLNSGNCSVNILGDDISTVHDAGSHVLSVTRIALGDHVARLKDSVGDFSNREHFVEGLLTRNEGSVRSQHEVNTGVSNQSSLEVVQVDIQGTFKAKPSSQRRTDLSDETIQVLIGWTFDIQFVLTDIRQRLVIQTEGTLGVFQ